MNAGWAVLRPTHRCTAAPQTKCGEPTKTVFTLNLFWLQLPRIPALGSVETPQQKADAPLLAASFEQRANGGGKPG